MSGCTTTMTPIHKLSQEYKGDSEVSTQKSRLIILKNIPFLQELDGAKSAGSAVLSSLIAGDSMAQHGYAIFDISESADDPDYLGYLPNSHYAGSPMLAAASFATATGNSSSTMSSAQINEINSGKRGEHYKRFYTTPGLVTLLPPGKKKIAYTYIRPTPPEPKVIGIGIQPDAIEIDLEEGKTHYVLLQRRKSFAMHRHFVELKGIDESDINKCEGFVEQAMNEEFKNAREYEKKLYSIADSEGYSDKSWKRFCYLLSGFSSSEKVPETQAWFDKNKESIVKKLNRRLNKGIKPRFVTIVGKNNIADQ